MKVSHYWLVLLLVSRHEWMTGVLCGLSPYIRHYEILSYDREDLHRKHLRATRDTHLQDPSLHLDFTAFHRTFRLILKQDATTFAKEFIVANENGPTYVNLSHIYAGTLEGERGSTCFGSVLEGQFEGTIHTPNGTYHIEAMQRYTSAPADHHTMIYHEDDMVLPLLASHTDGFCAAEHLNKYTQNFGPDQETPTSRPRRAADESKTSCLLHVHVDHLYFNKFKTVEAVVAQVSTYIRAVNEIYGKFDFEGIKLLNFRVKSLFVMNKEDTADPLSPLYIGAEKLLSLYSENNWGNFCLSYLFTNRDYSGTLGLAWEGKTGNWGGICSRQTNLQNGRASTLNTGLITIQNYGQFLPPRHVQLTLAHELGHSLGSPHDEGANCGNHGSADGEGRYLMYPYATDEVRVNSLKFSTCSIKHISRILRLKKDNCFVVSDQPICGNQIVEKGEECDVGHNDADQCCFSAKENIGVQCRLKENKACSPSQGLCCGQDCTIKSAGQMCDEETECLQESVCSGLSPICPKPNPKENLTICSQGTRVCQNGVCAESLCVKHSLRQCDCPGTSMKDKCHMCCQQPDKPETCASTTSSVLSRFFQNKRLPLASGAPCSGNQGYCDKFHICRILDADGPIARLKNSFLDLDHFEDMGDWMKAHWWAILLAILTLSAVMGCTVFLCSQTLNTRDLD